MKLATDLTIFSLLINVNLVLKTLFPFLMSILYDGKTAKMLHASSGLRSLVIGSLFLIVTFHPFVGHIPCCLITCR